MPKKQTRKVATRKQKSMQKLLEELVMPALKALHEEGGRAPSIDQNGEDEANRYPSACGQVRGGWPVWIEARPIDGVVTQLRITMLTGYVISNTPLVSLYIGHLLDTTPFRVRSHYELGAKGQLAIACDLTVRLEDGPLVERRLTEMCDIINDLIQLLLLRAPQYLVWDSIRTMEIDWQELPHDDIENFLDEGLAVPRSERTPLTLLRIAEGLSRWKDVLKLLKEHREELPTKDFAPLKCMALHELKRWLPAIRAARSGGIRKGCYPQAKWASPSYVNSLIQAGDEIEAMRILGKYKEGVHEPAHYDWLRGLAFQRAGEEKLAGEAFDRHFGRWPNDVIGRGIVAGLAEDGEG